MNTTQKIIPILDNGHGANTPGKRSPVWPDGRQLFECEFNRDIVRRICAQLSRLSIEFGVLVPEFNDVPLAERCYRANQLHKEYQGRTVLFSIHANAGGGTGWECWTFVGDTPADPIATLLCQEAEREFAPEWRMRFDYTDGDPDKESQFYILKHTQAPAILSENFFMDNARDCQQLLMTSKGRDRIAAIHVRTIEQLLK